MRYEVYGVYNKSGVNVFLSSFRSLSKANDYLNHEFNNVMYKHFIILKKTCKNSSPIGFLAGDSKKENNQIVPTISVNCVNGKNPTRKNYGKQFWEKYYCKDIEGKKMINCQEKIREFATYFNYPVEEMIDKFMEKKDTKNPEWLRNL
jgi:hypothetical protein